MLVPTPAVRNLIREGKTHQIYSAIQTSGSIGMQTMDAHLAQLVRMGRISRQLAEQRASVPEELKRLLGPSAERRRPGSGRDDATEAEVEHLRLPCGRLWLACPRGERSTPSRRGRSPSSFASAA